MSSGHIEVFNVQSGIHRGEVGRPNGNEKKNLILMALYNVTI